MTLDCLCVLDLALLRCDADPDVLSKYVLALIQNDPKKEGLQDTCVAKLEEFLGDGTCTCKLLRSLQCVDSRRSLAVLRNAETRGFVSRLFKALESGSYKANNEDDASARRGDDDQQQNQYAGDDEHSRRRGRANSEDDDDERRRFNKRRRDDDHMRDGPRRDLSRRQPAYAGRGDMRGAGGRGPPNGMGPMGGRGDPNFGGRRNFVPEWGMPPPQHMGMWQPPHFAPPGAFPMPEFDPNGFNPENPAMGGPPPHMGMMMPRHMGGAPFYPHQGGRGGRGGRGPGHFGGRGGEFGGKDDREGGGVDHNNGYAYGGGVPGAKTTLRVSNVDPKYVNMTKLSLHFSKFGNVVNVQMRPSFKCAYVQYASEEEAKKAFHSPIPVCNNRFIEVKWAKYDAKDPQGAPSIAEQSAEEAKDGESAATSAAAGTSSASASSVAAESSGADGAATENVASEGAAAEKTMTSEELRAAALEQGRKVLEQKRELLEKQRQLMKQKEELLKRQLTQHKELLERMSQNSDKFSIADKRDLLNKIMALSEDLRALQPRAGATAAGLTRSNSSGDVASDGATIPGLKAELSALEAEASTNSHASGYGGRGTGAGRWGAGGRGYQRGGGRGGRGGRGFPAHSHTLDNRTTIVKVENLPEAARDTSVLEQHFGNFGAIERVVVDAAAPSRGFIKFQDRYGGQAALTHGGVFGDATLELAWAEPQDAPAALSQRPEASAAVASDGATEVRGW